jgi:hypothetical protein
VQSSFWSFKIKIFWIAVMKTHTFGKSMTKPLYESLAQPLSEATVARWA